MCLCRLKEALPEGTKVTILADRGFGDAKLFGFLKKLGFEHVIRFRGDIFVTAADGETRRAEDCVGAGRATRGSSRREPRAPENLAQLKAPRRRRRCNSAYLPWEATN